MSKARIKLFGDNINKITSFVNEVKEVTEKLGVSLTGPITLPTKKLKITTRRSPDGEGKASWERYEMRIHKSLIDLGIDERALRLVMRVPIPEGLHIEIEMIE